MFWLASTSPSTEMRRRTILAEICVPRMKLSSRRSPMRMMRQSRLFLIVTIAWLLKMIVLLLFLGLDNFENTSPTMKAWMMQPITA